MEANENATTKSPKLVRFGIWIWLAWFGYLGAYRMLDFTQEVRAAAGGACIGLQAGWVQNTAACSFGGGGIGCRPTRGASESGCLGGVGHIHVMRRVKQGKTDQTATRQAQPHL